MTHTLEPLIFLRISTYLKLTTPPPEPSSKQRLWSMPGIATANYLSTPSANNLVHSSFIFWGHYYFLTHHQVPFYLAIHPQTQSYHGNHALSSFPRKSLGLQVGNMVLNTQALSFTSSRLKQKNWTWCWMITPKRCEWVMIQRVPSSVLNRGHKVCYYWLLLSCSDKAMLDKINMDNDDERKGHIPLIISDQGVTLSMLRDSNHWLWSLPARNTALPSKSCSGAMAGPSSSSVPSKSMPNPPGKDSGAEETSIAQIVHKVVRHWFHVAPKSQPYQSREHDIQHPLSSSFHQSNSCSTTPVLPAAAMQATKRQREWLPEDYDHSTCRHRQVQLPNPPSSGGNGLSANARAQSCVQHMHTMPTLHRGPVEDGEQHVNPLCGSAECFRATQSLTSSCPHPSTCFKFYGHASIDFSRKSDFLVSVYGPTPIPSTSSQQWCSSFRILQTACAAHAALLLPPWLHQLPGYDFFPFNVTSLSSWCTSASA